MSFSTEHISYIERGFLEKTSSLDSRNIRWQRIGNGTSLYLAQIISVPRLVSSDNLERSQDNRAFYMSDLLAGIHGVKHSLMFAVVGSQTEVSLFIATRNPSKTDGAVLPSLLNSTYPGIEVQPTDLNYWASLFNELPYGALITGTPSNKSKANQVGDQQIDRLIRGLYGTNWAYITAAEPLELSSLQQLSANTLSELKKVSDFEESSKNKFGNPIAEKYKQLLNRFGSKVQAGKSQGMWHTISYLLADTPQTLDRAKAISTAVFGGAASLPDPIRTMNLDGLSQQVASMALPSSPPEPPIKDSRFQYLSYYLSLLSSPELAAMVHLPTQEVKGFFVRPQAKFDVTPHNEKSEHEIELGEIVNRGQSTGVSYTISPNALTRHTMVVGTTGSGKTNTVFHLLRQLAVRDIPFLVIEPAKTEYRALLESDELKDKLHIFTLGKETVSPFRLNPFQILPGVAVQTHIDHLKSVFNASFVMYAPMPYVLEQCIHEIYEDKGWDLVTNENHRGLHERSHPTLTDLYQKIDEVVDRLGYASEITMNVKAALKTRINSLRIGGKGMMLDTHASLPINTLLQAPTILELDPVGDDDEKAFLIGLIVMSIYEHYRSNGHTENGNLKHVTVVEEAHRLLKKTPQVTDLETANMAGKAVESFSNILAEIRAYGEGIVVAEQIPSKLTPDILKNTNLKIVHRTIAEEDRRLVGGAMNLEPDHLRWLGSCSVGEAAIFGESDDNPIRVKIPYRKIEGMVINRDRDSKVHEVMTALKSRYVECFSLYPWSPIEPTILQKHHNQARRIVDNSEFQEVFARYVISAVVAPPTLLSEFPNLAQVVWKYTGQSRTQGLLETVLIHGIDWLFEIRGRQTGANYIEVEQLKQKFAETLLSAIDPARYPSQQMEHISAVQLEFKRIFQCNISPFAGCNQVCTERECLYRYNVLPLAQTNKLYDRFKKIMEHSPAEETGEKLANLSIEAHYKVLATVSADILPVVERQRVSLCFLLHWAEAYLKQDSWQKGRLLTEVIPVVQSKLTQRV